MAMLNTGFFDEDRKVRMWLDSKYGEGRFYREYHPLTFETKFVHITNNCKRIFSYEPRMGKEPHLIEEQYLDGGSHVKYQEVVVEKNGRCEIKWVPSTIEKVEGEELTSVAKLFGVEPAIPNPDKPKKKSWKGSLKKLLQKETDDWLKDIALEAD